MTSTIIAGALAVLGTILPAGAAASDARCGPAMPGEDQLTSPLVVLGETHGTKEIPVAFGGLVCRAAAQSDARVLVGLEIPASEQAAIDAFLEGDGSDAVRATLLKSDFWQREYQDGRSSGAIVDLLSAIRGFRQAGSSIVVRAIDANQASGAERDARMASAIEQAQQAHHPTRTFVLVGDVHSRVLKGYPWDPAADYVPLGAHLKAGRGEMVGLSVKARRGSAWVCVSAKVPDCGPRGAKVFEFTGAAPRLALDPAAAGQTGWSGTLYLEELSPSVPARLPAAAGAGHAGATVSR